ncbi:MAG: M61 family metallopeptidase [Balneolaceae bacterium]|nr:M61 family metallopeptidase [Balneolaceae bacterium]
MIKILRFVLILTNVSIPLQAQTVHKYEISFENAIHHEAQIKATFTNLDDGPFEVRMSRTSPGRYAIHNFAKNVYAVSARDGQGNELKISRPNPQQWDVTGHDGTVVFEYTLFANRGDGTYSQIDETHASLNIPATFAYARNYMHRPVEITFNVREDLNWSVATQLKYEGGTTYSAPDGYYFMDSPVLIGDFHLREEMVDDQLIRLALQSPANDSEVNEYFSKVMAIVKAQKEIFGELPSFDYGEYTFLLLYMPNASRDGMEHRNSTIVTNQKAFEEPLAETSIGTISHEFFHVWNIERIRPASLEPFDFEEANMSGELWFAEGFTSYYTTLTLVRAGIWSEEEYADRLVGSINRVFNSPGLQFFNPIEMSYRAPFVDAATSIDPTNNENIFVSYYTYGSVLGLALDLSLRTRSDDKNLDDYFKLIWELYGKTEIPYSIRDLKAALASYTDQSFADDFFSRFVYQSQMPDFAGLLREFGIVMEKANPGRPTLGNRLLRVDGGFQLSGNAVKGSPLYEAGIQSSDIITSIGGRTILPGVEVEEILEERRPGQTITIKYVRFGEERTARVRLMEDQNYKTSLVRRPTRSVRENRNAWLGIE